MQDFLVQFGKEIAVALVTAIGALFVFLLKHFFSERKRRLIVVEKTARANRDKAERQIEELKYLILNVRDDVRKSHEILKDKLYEHEKQEIREYGELRGKLNNVGSMVSTYSENVSKLTGRVDDQLSMTASHISTISHMSKQIDALFKFADAKKRASDCQDPNGHAD